MSETTHRALRLALASLLTVALLAQLAIGLSRTELTVANFFSLFTVLSNTAAVVVLAVLAWEPGRSSSERFSLVRGAVTVYMGVTALIYAFLPSATRIGAGLTEPWVGWSLHVIGPLALTIDWALFPPEAELQRHAPFSWLIFPAAYLVYSLSRGAAVEWYAYPFLSPLETGGYGGVALWSAVVLVAILGFGYAYHWWANRRSATLAAA